MAAWAAGHLEWPSVATGAAVVVGAIAGLAAGHRCAQPVQAVHLRWDGEAWHVDDRRGDLRVMLDLERWMLLRMSFEDGRAGRWIAVSLSQRVGDWRALRTALYSRAPGATPATPAGRPVQPAARRPQPAPPDRATD